MPTYQYACTACDHRFDAVQAFSDSSLTECPACTGGLRKVFSSVGIVFKGSGFYRTDSRAAATVANGDAKADAKVDAKAGSNGSEGSSGSKDSGSTKNGGSKDSGGSSSRSTSSSTSSSSAPAAAAS